MVDFILSNISRNEMSTKEIPASNFNWVQRNIKSTINKRNTLTPSISKCIHYFHRTKERTHNSKQKLTSKRKERTPVPV